VNKLFTLFPEQASDIARWIDLLYLFEIVVSAIFATLIFFLVIYFAIRYRRRDPDRIPEPIEGHRGLELIWTIIPLVLVMIMFGWGVILYFRAAVAPDDAMPVYVVGKQWMWKLQHPNGRREINELHVPVGQPVKLIMSSEDVIHSFFVPAFRMKQDVLPGRYTTAWFRPTKPGTYHLFCAEYCGTQHSRMIGRVVVMNPAEYQVWLGGVVVGESMEQAGARLFDEQRCNTCHAAGDSQLGPSLIGVFGSRVELEGGGSAVADEAYLRESILKPQARTVRGYQPVMPTYETLLSEEQLMQIIAYLKSLGTTPRGGVSP
jgi:cytochrome c oxidase subunit 2